MSTLPFNLATQTLPFDDPSAATAASYAQLHSGRVMPSLDAHDEHHAAVYMAALDGRDCAIKPLPGVRADSIRVVRWCRALEALPPHSNVVKPLHIAFTRGRSYLVMPYVHAYNLAEYRAVVYGGKPLPEEVVRLLSFDVLCGLYHLRLHHLAHRAVHPGNVLVDAHTGVARVTDLGYCAVLPQQQQQQARQSGDGGVVAALSLEQHLPAASRAWSDPAVMAAAAAAAAATTTTPTAADNNNSNSATAATVPREASAHVSPTAPLFDTSSNSNTTAATASPPREAERADDTAAARTTATSAATAAAAVTATDALQAMTAADVWGFGVILHAMCSNSGKPFAYNNNSNNSSSAGDKSNSSSSSSNASATAATTTAAASFDAMATREYAGTGYSDELYDVLRQCLQPDARKRPSLFQLFRHSFLFPALLIALEASRVQAQQQLDSGNSGAGGVTAGLVGGAGAAVSRVAQQMRDAGVAGSVGWALSSLRERASAVVSSLMTPAAQEAQLLAQIRPDGGQPQLPRQPFVHDDYDNYNNNNNNTNATHGDYSGMGSSNNKAGSAADMAVLTHPRDDNDHHGRDDNNNNSNTAAHTLPVVHTAAAATPSAATTMAATATTAMDEQRNTRTTM